jgi:putative membrane protein
MAVERTRLAHERTLMAWVRTATSLISFGFTIYKAFQYMQDQQGGGVVHRAFSPRAFALTMIALGIGGLALATTQHWREVGSLYRAFGKPAPRSTARIVASIVSCLGIAALVLVLLRQ